MRVYCKSCDLCQRRKRPCKTPESSSTSLTCNSRGISKGGKHTMGPMPHPTRRGNRYILVVWILLLYRQSNCFKITLRLRPSLAELVFQNRFCLTMGRILCHSYSVSYGSCEGEAARLPHISPKQMV